MCEKNRVPKVLENFEKKTKLNQETLKYDFESKFNEKTSDQCRFLGNDTKVPTLILTITQGREGGRGRDIYIGSAG